MRCLLIFLSGLSLLSARDAVATGLVSGHYVFRAMYAPVCLNGTYPIVFGNMTTGNLLTVATNATGQLSGTIDIRGLTSAMTGSLSLQNNNVTLDAQISGSNPYVNFADMSGALHGRQFKGDAEDPEGVAPFYMDVSLASALIVTFDVNLTVDANGNVTGNGTASSCALDVPITVTGTNGVNCTLHIVGTNLSQFTWDGSGPATAFGFVASWNAHGYGFSPSGSQLPIFAPNAPALAPYVTSRKNHRVPSGVANLPEFTTLDISLPATGSRIECRSGGPLGNHQLVVSFPKNITLNPPNGTSGVQISSGVGSVSGFLVRNNEVIVNLIGVANAQTIGITLHGVSDGTNIADVAVSMSVLVGDVNGDGFVDAVDTSRVKSQSGVALTQSNVRDDVNLDGFIDAVDTSLVKSVSGTALPASVTLKPAGGPHRLPRTTETKQSLKSLRESRPEAGD